MHRTTPSFCFARPFPTPASFNASSYCSGKLFAYFRFLTRTLGYETPAPSASRRAMFQARIRAPFDVFFERKNYAVVVLVMENSRNRPKSGKANRQNNNDNKKKARREERANDVSDDSHKYYAFPTEARRLSNACKARANLKPRSRRVHGRKKNGELQTRAGRGLRGSVNDRLQCAQRRGGILLRTSSRLRAFSFLQAH